MKGERAHLTVRYPFNMIPSVWPTATAAADAIGVQPRTVRRWKIAGVPADQSDQVACAAGVHPFEIWPELADQAVADAHKPCEGCETPFLPVNGNQRFCTPGCRKKMALRRWRATPAGREYNRAQCRMYYAENGDYERSQRARDYYAKKALNLETGHGNAA